MQRREFMTLLCGAAAAWPVGARAQQPERMRRIGVLSGNRENDPQAQRFLAAFNEAMRELGWIDGRNIKIEVRWAASDLDRMTTLAKELVSLQPDLIVGHTTPVVTALQRETKSIPIVFVVVSDPIGSGFVASLPRPAGNITGFVNLEASLAGKWIEMVREISPRVTRAAFMFNPDTAPYSYYLPAFEAAARSHSVEPAAMPVRDLAEIETSIANFAHLLDGALVVMPDSFTSLQSNYRQIIAVAARYRVPAIYPYRYMAEAGGLMSYGTDNADLFRRAPAYVDRILKGANPAELPVQLPTKFEFVLNLKTAKTLGLTVPQTLLTSADEVIE
jgi:putative ABC transport system substrate-binding protein